MCRLQAWEATSASCESQEHCWACSWGQGGACSEAMGLFCQSRSTAGAKLRAVQREMTAAEMCHECVHFCRDPNGIERSDNGRGAPLNHLSSWAFPGKEQLKGLWRLAFCIHPHPVPAKRKLERKEGVFILPASAKHYIFAVIWVKDKGSPANLEDSCSQCKSHCDSHCTELGINLSLHLSLR